MICLVKLALPHRHNGPSHIRQLHRFNALKICKSLGIGFKLFRTYSHNINHYVFAAISHSDIINYGCSDFPHVNTPAHQSKSKNPNARQSKASGSWSIRNRERFSENPEYLNHWPCLLSKVSPGSSFANARILLRTVGCPSERSSPGNQLE